MYIASVFNLTFPDGHSVKGDAYTIYRVYYSLKKKIQPTVKLTNEKGEAVEVSVIEGIATNPFECAGG